MRKVINGRTYNTETSKVIGGWDNGRSYNDFECCEETLYKNTKGAYFLYGEGGPMSKYAKSAGQNSWTGGSAITPMTASEAQEWRRTSEPRTNTRRVSESRKAAPSDLATRRKGKYDHQYRAYDPRLRAFGRNRSADVQDAG